MLTSTHASRMQSGTVRKNVLAHGRENRCRPALPGFFRNEGNATQGLCSQGRCNAAALALYQDMSAATGHPADTCGGNLRRKTIGHHAIIFDANVFPYTEAAGVLRMDKYLLGCAEVAAQKIAAANPQNTGIKRYHLVGSRFHCGFLQIHRMYPILFWMDSKGDSLGTGLLLNCLTKALQCIQTAGITDVGQALRDDFDKKGAPVPNAYVCGSMGNQLRLTSTLGGQEAKGDHLTLAVIKASPGVIVTKTVG